MLKAASVTALLAIYTATSLLSDSIDCYYLGPVAICTLSTTYTEIPLDYIYFTNENHKSAGKIKNQVLYDIHTQLREKEFEVATFKLETYAKRWKKEQKGWFEPFVTTQVINRRYLQEQADNARISTLRFGTEVRLQLEEVEKMRIEAEKDQKRERMKEDIRREVREELNKAVEDEVRYRTDEL